MLEVFDSLRSWTFILLKGEMGKFHSRLDLLPVEVVTSVCYGLSSCSPALTT